MWPNLTAGFLLTYQVILQQKTRMQNIRVCHLEETVITTVLLHSGLKTLEFGYTLPKQIVNKIMFNNIRIFFRGSNILTFSKFKLWDPELHSSTGTEYPLSRSLTFGLTVNI